MKKTYLVTGGTGFIGSALVRALVANGAKVRVFDNGWRGSANRLDDIRSKLELVTGDIRDPKMVSQAVRGVDSVCHLAAINGTENFYKQPELVLDVGVKGMLNVLDACRENNVGEVLVMSSSEVYQTPEKIPTDETAPLLIPSPLNPRYSYGASKVISEVLSVNFGRKYLKRVLIVRPHNVYGPEMGWEHVVPQFVKRIKEIAATPERKIRVPIQGTGLETRAFCYISDMVAGAITVLEKGEHLNIYHVGTDVEVPIADLAQEIGRFYGKDVEVVPGTLTEGSTQRRCPDITKIRGMGFVPKVSFSDGIRQTTDWYDQQIQTENQKERRTA